MPSYYVTATTRDVDCDSRTAISQLVLDEQYKGSQVWSVRSLYDLANQHSLFSKCDHTGKVALVRIYWSATHSRWIATTNRDNTQCDNLLSKPIMRATKTDGTTTYYNTCSI